ncbi:MAG TPA: HD domain-containing protein [Campylobacterales bacterium]|nr:HD domain-containing protein [Campylobacterales bacterium]
MRELGYRIEDILERNGNLFQISKEIRKYIEEYRKGLKEEFINGLRGRQFVLKYNRFYDSIISLIYKVVLRKMFKNYLPMRNSIPIVIVALGSYGREEMTIHSDIDLMVAYVEIEGFNIEKIIEKFIYLAWDSGLKLGHRVHSISEIVKVAKSNETIKTAMIESRKIIGSSFVWGVLQDQLNIIREDEKEEFITQKMEYRAFGKVKLYGAMEVDLKEGIGGLRDSNGLFWILNVLYRANSIRDLVDELFSESEYRSYISAMDYILSVRTALHLINKKKRDKIVLDDIPMLSEMVGISSHVQFSQKLIQSLWVVRSFTNRIVCKVVQKNRTYKIGNLVELLTSLPDSDTQIESILIEIDSVGELDRNQFLKLFQRKHLYPVIEFLTASNHLHKIFRPFEKVMFYPQFDGYHKHSVDIHSIKSLKEIENIEVEPLKSIYHSLTQEERIILKIATLFHDVGKGRIDDHRKVGAKIVKQFLNELGIGCSIVERVVLLIRHHTLMSEVAYHEDIYSDKVIFSFNSKLKDETNLKLLYLLTYGDAKSVAGSLNSYSLNLLNELYRNSIGSFGNRELLKEGERREKRERQISNSERFKNLPRNLQKRILKIASNLAFFKFSNDELLDIAEWLYKTENFDFKIENRDFLSLKVVRKNICNFDISYLLNKTKFLSVVSLDIFELFDGGKYFQIDFLESIDIEDIPYIEEIVRNSFLKQKREKIRDIPKIGADEVVLNYDYSNSYAKIFIHTKNQNGLLAYLFQVFEEFGIDIVSSKTQTFKRRVKDTFLAKKEANDREKFERVIREIVN